MGSYNSNLCCSRVNCIYTMGHYSATRKKDFLPFATTWMDIEGIMLSEISQTEEDKHCMILFICKIWKKGPTKTNPKQLRKWYIGTYISIITLNVNRLNAPTKRHRLAEWIQKQDPYICCLQETHFRPRDTYRLKLRGWKKIFHANRNQKKAGVAILISDKNRL